jgi:hypothetical protein
VSVERSTVALSFLFEMSRLYGGFFTSPKQLLEYQNWKFADVLSYIKYAFVGVALNDLTDFDFYCSPSAKSCTHSGNDLIKSKGYDQYTIAGCFGALLIYTFSCRVIAYFSLRFIKT